jgi:hypothetical protein
VQIVHETISKKAHHKKGLVEWLKEKALSSNPSTAKKKKNEEVGVVHAFGARYLGSGKRKISI